MFSLIFIGFESLALSLVLVPLARNLARTMGSSTSLTSSAKTQRPDSAYKWSRHIFGGKWQIRPASRRPIEFRCNRLDVSFLVFRLFPALAVVFGIGFIDDIVARTPRDTTKLFESTTYQQFDGGSRDSCK
jgi:nitrate reductase NapE component